MRVTRFWLLLFGVWFASASPLVVADAPRQSELDEARLKAVGLKSDGVALVEFFHKRTLSEAEQEKVQKLLRQLGARLFRAREEAAAELIAHGPNVLMLLKECVRDADLEIGRRAGNCIQRIQEKDVPAEVVRAAVRLLAVQKPPQAVETLLAYLTATDDELVAEEIRTTLTALTTRDGRTDKALIAALTDKAAVRRGAAAEALTRAGDKNAKGRVRKLLADPDVAVRFRVASALAYARDREAVPVLIQLLSQLPPNLAWQSEDMLYRLAEGQTPPTVSLGVTPESRKKSRDAWEAWWTVHGAKVDLARLSQTPRLLGYTLLVLLDQGRVVEVDSKNKVLWQVDNLTFPLDVQLLPNERLLVAEYHANVVTERTRTGEIKWQRQVVGPIMAQRLPNGNTFIANADQLLEVDATGKTVFSFSPPEGDTIMKAMKLPNGESICLTFNTVRLLRVDATGKVISSFPVDQLSTKLSGGRIYGLSNGNVLIPHHGENKVVEYDPTGKVVWQANVNAPIAASRLPNGNTLVTSMERPYRAVEIDRGGQEVWRYQAETRVTRALRR